MKKYLVLKEFRPGNVDDLKIVPVEVENVTDERFEGGVSSPQTYWAYARYYWLGFDTAAEAEAHRDAAATQYVLGVKEDYQRRLLEVISVLEAHQK